MRGKMTSELEPAHATDDAPNATDFGGTWRLVSFDSRGSTNTIVHPWGDDPQGLLVYDEHGNMAGQVTRSHRLVFASDDVRDGTTDEVRAAFDGYIAYYGTYTIDTALSTVTHHITGSLFPNWVGVDQARRRSRRSSRARRRQSAGGVS